ncbi:hypothetical protein [Salibacterium lacus]|uniref:Uncharacterized protein n=1 Tax=Salibacterium lacus TaxID=1898109 RepID=A0ABW5T4Z6_9BACI
MAEEDVLKLMDETSMSFTAYVPKHSEAANTRIRCFYRSCRTNGGAGVARSPSPHVMVVVSPVTERSAFKEIPSAYR